jgi:hypothetical protein
VIEIWRRREKETKWIRRGSSFVIHGKFIFCFYRTMWGEVLFREVY